MKITHYQYPTSEKEMDKLKELTGEENAKDAIRVAVEEYIEKHTQKQKEE